MRSLFAFGVVLAGMTSNVLAATLVSGPAYGGPTQAVAVCYIYNSGAGNLTINEIKIVKEPDGASLPVVSNNCGTGFGPGGICRTVSNVSTGYVVACKATLAPKATARGSMEIRNSTNGILNSRDLR